MCWSSIKAKLKFQVTTGDWKRITLISILPTQEGLLMLIIVPIYKDP